MLIKNELKGSNNKLSKTVYHYSNNNIAFNILKSKEIWLSDIKKSSDYLEMQLFFPGILDSIQKCYDENPFPLIYNKKQDREALMDLLDIYYRVTIEQMEKNKISNFAICFSEESDLLSQWRAYADDGRGCCIGFDVRKIQSFCQRNSNVFRFQKVKYIKETDIPLLLKREAELILKTLSGLREWIVENFSCREDLDDTDGLLVFNFSGMVDSVITDSLGYKSITFKEEKEWRLFMQNSQFKHPDFVFRDDELDFGPNITTATVSLLKNRMEFNIKKNDIVSYFPISFSELNNPLASLIIGPKSNINEIDAELYLKKHTLEAEIGHSKISYY